MVSVHTKRFLVNPSSVNPTKKSSIRTRIFLSYLFIVVVMTIPLGYLFYGQGVIASKYSSAIENMLLIESIPDDTNALISVYRKLIFDIENQDLGKQYSDLVGKLEVTHAVLDETITNEDSMISYQGLHNVDKEIVNKMDRGIDEARNGDIVTPAAVLDEITKIGYYLKEDTAELVLQELGTMNEFQGRMIESRRVILLLGVAMIVATSVGCLIMALFYSKQIIAPIMGLSELALKITGGDFDVQIPEEFIESNDETGILSLSFRNMLAKLRSQIQELNDSNVKLGQAQNSIQQKNVDLERVNKLMVGRELKMIELKKEVEDLRKGIQQGGNNLGV